MVRLEELTVDEMIADAKESSEGMTLEQKQTKLKDMKANKRYKTDNVIARLNFNLWVSEGDLKVLNTVVPEYAEKTKFETKIEDRKRVKADNTIEIIKVKLYKLAINPLENFAGKDKSDLDVLQYVEIDEEDQNLSDIDKIRKYQVSENVYMLKKQAELNEYERRYYKVLKTQAALMNQRTKIAVFQAAIQADQRANAAALLRSRAGFLNAEGRKIFGIED